MKILLVLYDGGKSAEEEPRLLGTTENKLGISEWLADQGHELITTSDKEGSGSEFRKHIVDADILITTPFHPGYLTREVMESAKNLKLCITAGVGSDHIVRFRDFRAAPRSLCFDPVDRCVALTGFGRCQRAQDHGGRGHRFQRGLGRRTRPDADPHGRPKLYSRSVASVKNRRAGNLLS